MKTKKLYLTPDIELIRLDNDISLQLASDVDPMGEPDWSGNLLNAIPMDDPMKNQQA